MIHVIPCVDRHLEHRNVVDAVSGALRRQRVSIVNDLRSSSCEKYVIERIGGAGCEIIELAGRVRFVLANRIVLAGMAAFPERGEL